MASRFDYPDDDDYSERWTCPCANPDCDGEVDVTSPRIYCQRCWDAADERARVRAAQEALRASQVKRA